MRLLLPCLLALSLPLACTGTPPEGDSTAQPPQTTEPAEPDPEPEPVDTAAPEPQADPEVPPDPWGPISAEQRQIMMAGPEEDWITTEIHYVKTNERRHDVWFPFIKDKGGVYVGVAADQNYTLIAVAKSEFVFLMDLDWRVAELHRAYEVLIENSDTPAILLERYHESKMDESAALIESALASELDAEHLRKTLMSWKGSRETVYRHLDKVIVRTEGGAATSWLSNPEYYAHIRTLYQNDRVRMLVGNLTGPNTVKTIAKAAEGLGIPVQVLYLSNAEEYYKYHEGSYRESIAALPIVDHSSVVLRTIYSDKWVHADSLWNYQVQPLADYKARLDANNANHRNRMMALAEKEGVLERDAGGVAGLSTINVSMLGDASASEPTATQEAAQ